MKEGRQRRMNERRNDGLEWRKERRKKGRNKGRME